MPIVKVPGGSLILPMDTLYQDAGMFEVYGLVHRLLAEKIPVIWLIQPGKAYGGTDFVASATDFRTGAPIENHAYAGGPFAVDARHAEAAAPIVQAWQAAHDTTVHVATAEFEAPVYAIMPRAPRIAVAQPVADHLFHYLNAAGIPDSAGHPWSAASLDALSPAEVANGALFGDETGPERQRVYDVLLVPPVPDEVWSDPAALAELDAFVQQGGHLHAFGHAIAILENRLFFLTAEGIPAFGNRGQTGTFTPAAPDWGLSQAVPAARLQAVPPANPFQPFPSDRTWLREQPGLIYRPETRSIAYFLDRSGAPCDFMISGPYKSGTGAGRVTYQGGGAFSTAAPYSENSEAPYLRCVLNSVLLPVTATEAATLAAPLAAPSVAIYARVLCDPADGGADQCGPAPVPVITKAPSAITVPGGTEVTWTLTTANTGINTLFSPVITDTLPAGFTFLSASPTPTSVAPGPGGTTIITWTAPEIPTAIPTGAGPTIVLTARAPVNVSGTFTNQARLSGKDLLGIPHSASATADVTVGSGMPTVEIISPLEGATLCGTVEVVANASSPAGIHDVTFFFSLDGGLTWTAFATDFSGPPFTATLDTTLLPEVHLLIRAVATANNGQTAEEIHAYIIDNTPPTVAITAPPNGSTVSGTITVTGTATDNIHLAFVEWFVDGTLKATQTSPPFAITIDSTQLSEGPHTVTLRACDNCPNCAEASITILVQNAPPPPVTVVITSPPNGATICGTVSIVANASSPVGIHDVTFAYSLDGGLTWVSFATDFSGPPFTASFDTTMVPDGPILIRAEATANNGQTAADVNAYVVDNTPPVVAITSPPSGSVVMGTIIVTGAATDNIALALVEWLVDGTVVETETTPPFALSLDTTQLSEGPHTITLRACDRCPNCAEASITINVRNVPQTQVKVDHTIPIPRRKPPAEQIIDHRVEIRVEQVHVFPTSLGTKVIVTGRVCVLVTYAADVRDQSVHAVEACFPFTTFFLAPGLAPNARVRVTTELEFASFKLLDPRTISKFIIFRVIANPL